MVVNIILLTMAAIALAAGTYSDIRTREVPDWINYGLIISGLGIRLIYALFTQDITIFSQGLLGLGIGVALGYLLFYTGQWGGGDSKLLMGLGAAIGVPFIFQPFPLFLLFLINVLLVGAFYGIIYALVLAIIHKKRFKTAYTKLLVKYYKINKIGFILMTIAVIVIVIISDNMRVGLLLSSPLILSYLALYLLYFMKAVEQVAMIKKVQPEALTEGDWIVNDIIIDKQKICGPKDLGINKKQISQLIKFKKEGKIKKITVKHGIPFVPSFLMAFLFSLAIGEWWNYLL